MITRQRYQHTSFGTQTAAIGVGGYTPATGIQVATSEQYDGTSWQQVQETLLNTARRDLGSLLLDLKQMVYLL
jgi:hypothetical protein